MDDQMLLSSPLRDFVIWEPVLRLLLAADAEGSAGRTRRVEGRISRHTWRLDLPDGLPSAEMRVVEDLRRSFDSCGLGEMLFAAEVQPDGSTTLHLAWASLARTRGFPDLAVLTLVDGVLPEPWRRLPDPVPGAAPAPSADLELLERTLRERLPDAVGATEEEIAATEARLGVTLSDELKVLYRVTRARWDWEDFHEDYEEADRVNTAVGCELSSLEELYSVDAARRHSSWSYGATDAVHCPPDAAVQGLAGSPGWIVFGSNGGDELAVDLTPGPGGHTGQVILVSHETNLGADLIADSLTDFVLDRTKDERCLTGSPPAVARVRAGSLESIQAAAHPALEVLSIDSSDGAPFSLAPLSGLTRLRALTAGPGVLSDPPEIAGLVGLEYLELPVQEWRVILDAAAVPRTLLAAAIKVQRDEDPLSVAALADEILALWDRTQIVQTVLEGNLGPAES
ncbi:SMI1/KNR4 family protein [Streptomyces sp. NPDC089915]|uniref:SMI1/KNR4 family protein n=1 Tax=Streptomyces sp. NPDC089915 TaxID=3155186 RepID=UPI0034336408